MRYLKVDLVLKNNTNSISNQLEIFKTIEEKNDFERISMSKLSSIECLQRMRKFINLAYGMHGFDPENLPKTREIKIIFDR